MLSENEVTGVLKTDAEAKRFFPLWWNLFGKKFEFLCQSAVKKEEIASYAFVAGYVAGRDKTRREEER